MTMSRLPPGMQHESATLVDLLDRVLDRGLVINADIIISLAGVPLIGLNLRAALAGIETMVRYGLAADERNYVLGTAQELCGPAALVAAAERQQWRERSESI